MLTNEALANRWLRIFLDHRALEQPDGRALYALRCTDLEWGMARAVIRDVVGAGLPVGAFGDALGAVFCLYAAEWWRRNHEGGSWAWHKVFDDLGVETPTMQAIYRAVQGGLRWWRRCVLRSGDARQYLVTLACEGGLPLRLLQRDGTSFRRYFRAVFEEFRYHQGRAYDPSELASRAAPHLPLSLRRPEVFALGGALVESIWKLQGELGESANPLDDLDVRHPGWRGELPLRLEDTLTQDLLRGLVLDAVEIARRPRSGLRVETSAERDGDAWVLRRRVRCPSEMSAESLAEVLGTTTAGLPRRFSLYVQARGGRTLVLAHCTRRAGADDEAAYLLEGYGRAGLEIPPGDARKGLELLAVAPGSTFATSALQGGDALGEVPWIFTEEPGQEAVLRFVAAASHRSRQAALYVAVPPGAALVMVEGARSTTAGTIVGERALVRVEGGAARVRDVLGDEFNVATGANVEDHEEAVWVGRTVAVATAADAVYRGLPRLVAVLGDGARRVVPERELEWRPRDARGPWRPWGESCVGEVVVQHRVGAEVRLRTRMTVLPRAFEVNWPEPAEGAPRALVLCGVADARVSAIDGTRGVRAELRGALWALTPAEEHAPGTRLTVRMEWPGETSARVTLPSPHTGVRFLYGETPLGDGDEVALEHLASVTLEVQGPPARGPYTLVGRTRANDLPTQEVRVALSAVAPGLYRLDLVQARATIDSRLAMSRDLDARVTLTVEARHGADRLRGSLVVGRVAGSLAPAGDDIVLADAARTRLYASLAALRVEARPLWRPLSDAAVDLAMIEPGRWAFERGRHAPGPWIALAWLGPWCCARPLLVTVTPAEGAATAPRSSLAPTDGESAADTLEAAVREPSRELREAAFDRIFCAMTGDVNHPAWASLEGFVATLGELPATTFDVIDRLIAHPAACAMALLVWGSTRFDALWYGLERLPFLWELVPARAWRDAVAAWAQGALEGVPDGLRETVRAAVASQLGALRAQVAVRSPSAAVALSDAARRVDIALTGDREFTTVVQLLSTPPLANAVAEGNVAEVTQRAWRAHADDRWPEWGGMLPALAELRAGLAPSLKGLVPVPDDHRSPALAAPVYAALCAATGAPVPLATLFELRRLREFDPDAWLDLHLWTTLRALARTPD